MPQFDISKDTIEFGKAINSLNRDITIFGKNIQEVTNETRKKYEIEKRNRLRELENNKKINVVEKLTSSVRLSTNIEDKKRIRDTEGLKPAGFLFDVI